MDSSVWGEKTGWGLDCTGVSVILEHRWFLDPSCKQFNQLAVCSGKQKPKAMFLRHGQHGFEILNDQQVNPWEVCYTWHQWLCGSGSRHRSSSCCRRGRSHKPDGLDRSGWRFGVCHVLAGPTPGPSHSGSGAVWSGNAALDGPQRRTGQTGPKGTSVVKKESVLSTPTEVVVLPL